MDYEAPPLCGVFLLAECLKLADSRNPTAAFPRRLWGIQSLKFDTTVVFGGSELSFLPTTRGPDYNKPIIRRSSNYSVTFMKGF